jgi:uncharacterized membrane protein YqjE
MNPGAIDDKVSGQTPTQGSPITESGVLEDAQSLWHELQGLVYDRFRLAALETQRAGESLIVMFVAGVMVAVLLSGVWLGLMTTAVLELVGNGFAVSSAILLAVAFTLLIALILCGVIRRKRRYLQFPATLRSLQPMSTGRRDAEKS